MGAKGSGRKKKIYRIKDYTSFRFITFKDISKNVRRNIVIAKYLCRDPYYKYALWQMIKTKAEYSFKNYHEVRKQCEPEECIKDVPETDLILGTVIAWSNDQKPMLEDKHQRSRLYIISLSVHFLLDAMREAIEDEVKKKGCKIYEFIPPKDIELRSKEPSLKRGVAK